MRGFSLVELSIVLVILGLLTGGILAGQNLIRAAEIRSSIAQYQGYTAAVNTFRDKYFALPGDFRDATKFWGAADSGDGAGTDCYGVASADESTCNGNGDGLIRNPSDAPSSTLHYYQEEFRFWQHLANAGLVEGSYTGTTDSASNSLVRTPGLNLPRAKLNTSDGVRVFWNITNSSHYFSGVPYDRNTFSMTNGLLPEEAWNIDTKLDDGSPVYGAVIAPKSTASWALNCTTTDNASDSEYNVQGTDKTCSFLVMFR